MVNMKIYTRHGDYSETSVIGGKKIAKDDAYIDAIGCIDELNSVIGIIISFSDDNELKEHLIKIQRTLFVIGSDLAAPVEEKTGTIRLSANKVSEIETLIDNINNELPKIETFILPGGNKLASLLHFARAVCRKSERSVVTLSKRNKINEIILSYLNRLSALLFVLARRINQKKKVQEMFWR